MDLKDIDVDYCFIDDIPDYLSDIDSDPILLPCEKDPDALSKTLNAYQIALYSRQLQNGSFMKLSKGLNNSLQWNDLIYGNDSIIVSLRYKKNRELLEAVADKLSIDKYKDFIVDFIRKSYTIGGEIFFPKNHGGINQTRGWNHYVCDRWDLTLECIRRYYNNEESPLSKVLNDNKDFFGLFVDFKGYVDFFFLQDMVSNDYNKVLLFLDTPLFTLNPFPKDADEYIKFIESELRFLKKRNERINAYIMGK